MKQKKGQVALETIAGIGIILFMFLIVSVDSLNKSITQETVENLVKDGARCRTIAENITSAYVQGKYSKIEISTEFDVNILGNEVSVGNTTCPVLGRVQDAVLEKGIIVLKNSDGIVVLENE